MKYEMHVTDCNAILKIEDVFASRGRTKILYVLATYGELNISEIVKKTGQNHSNVQKHLAFLIQLNLVQEKEFGRIKIYRFKTENKKANSLKNLIEFWENKIID